jgi:predicted GIY-YIG superfamily endonuclease
VRHVHILRSLPDPNRLYTGYTTCPDTRLQTHNAGGCPHTSKYTPWEMPFCCSFPDKTRALEFERCLKSHSGRAFAGKHPL